MNKLKLHTAAITAAAQSVLDKVDDKTASETALSAFKATGFTAKSDHALFVEWFNNHRRVASGLIAQTLPSEDAQTALKPV